MNIKEIESLIVDGLFVNGRMASNQPLGIEGLRGWISPLSDIWTNRITLDGTVECSGELVKQVVGLFSKSGKGFIWVVRPEDIDGVLPMLLAEHGLKQSRFYEVAGVHLYQDKADRCKNLQVRVQEADREQIERYIDIVRLSYGYSSNEYVRYMNYFYEEEPSIKMKLYFAYLDNDEAPVGYARTTYMCGNKVLLLNGAGVMKEHRGQGIYTQMLRHRIEYGIEDGIHHFIAQAARRSSYSTFKKMCFNDVCDLQIYEWAPTE